MLAVVFRLERLLARTLRSLGRVGECGRTVDFQYSDMIAVGGEVEEADWSWGELVEVRSREADEAENRGGLCAPGWGVTRRLELTTIVAPPPLYPGFRRQEAGSYTVCRLPTSAKMFKKGFVSELCGSFIQRTANSQTQILRVTKDQAKVLSPAFAADKDLRAVPTPRPPYRRNHP